MLNDLRVVVATDLSFGAGAAMRWVDMHLANANISVLHFHAPDPVESVRHGMAAERGPRDAALRADADAWLNEHAPRLHRRGGIVEIIHTEWIEAVVKVVRLRCADLLVVGQQGVETGSPRRLGRTAERLIRGALVPVLMVPVGSAIAPSRIIVALEDGEVFGRVLSWTRRFARRFEAEVIGVHVHIAAVPGYVLAAVGAADDEMVEARVTGAPAEGARDHWLMEMRDAGLSVTDASMEAAFGDPAQELVAAAERHGAGLLVLGRGTKGKVRRGLLGSVVRDVLRHATRPVLVVTEPEDELA